MKNYIKRGVNYPDMYDDPMDKARQVLMEYPMTIEENTSVALDFENIDIEPLENSTAAKRDAQSSMTKLVMAESQQIDDSNCTSPVNALNKLVNI